MNISAFNSHARASSLAFGMKVVTTLEAKEEIAKILKESKVEYTVNDVFGRVEKETKGIEGNICFVHSGKAYSYKVPFIQLASIDKEGFLSEYIGSKEVGEGKFPSKENLASSLPNAALNIINNAGESLMEQSLSAAQSTGKALIAVANRLKSQI